MVRIISVIVLFLSLIALAVFEQIYIKKTYDFMKTETKILVQRVMETPDLDDETVIADDVKMRAERLNNYWQAREHKLCTLIRHVDLSYISDALIYAKNFIEFDNKEESMAGLARLTYLLDTYSKMYGFNGANII